MGEILGKGTVLNILGIVTLSVQNRNNNFNIKSHYILEKEQLLLPFGIIYAGEIIKVLVF